MRPMRPWVLFLLAIAVLVATGCQPRQATRPPREKGYQSVVMRLRGRTQACDFPDMVKQVPVVASVKPDYEMLAEISPDLVLYDADLYSEQDVARIKEVTNADVWVMDATTIEEYVRRVYELGSLTGTETTANGHVNRIYEAIELAQSTAVEPRPRVAIILPGEGGSMIAGTGSFQADVVRHSGGEPVGPEGKGFVQLNPEQFATMNPQVIIVPGRQDQIEAYERVMRDPRFQTIDAVRDNRIRVVNEDVLLRRGGRINLLIAGVQKAISPTTK
jgi:iron complex transport system substrate-binding protein